ncbi:MAG: hypothetical protein LKI24_09760 [Acidipropionibacterium sp.]|nr:hypothetical protein [Acidipropionibacterium sp.]
MVRAEVMKKAEDDRMVPTGLPNWGRTAYQARCAVGACSAARVTAPDHSPPTARPWRNLRVASRVGAQIPMEDAGGRRPMSAVAPPIPKIVIIRTERLPTLSPRVPKMIPPTGRATNPMAKVANELMIATHGFSPEKNCVPNTSAAAVENR